MIGNKSRIIFFWALIHIKSFFIQIWPMGHIVCGGQLLMLKMIFGLNGNGMSQINMSSPNRASTTQSDKAQAHEDRTMKNVKGHLSNLQNF